MHERNFQVPLDAEALEALKLGPNWAVDIRKRLAASYYADGLLSLGQAARLAGVPYADFVSYLHERRIPLNYGPDDLAADVDQLKKLGLWDGPVGKR